MQSIILKDTQNSKEASTFCKVCFGKPATTSFFIGKYILVLRVEYGKRLEIS